MIVRVSHLLPIHWLPVVCGARIVQPAPRVRLHCRVYGAPHVSTVPLGLVCRCVAMMNMRD